MERGDPRADSRAFRRALGQFATGVTIVTTRVGEQLAGITVNSFSSVSLDPPLILCSIARTSRSLPVFEQATHLAVNVLSIGQVALASNFAGSAEDKFAGVAWTAGEGGAPVFADVAAEFHCRIVTRYEGGDHVIYMCEVSHFARHGKPLLVYANGRFGIAADHPGAAASKPEVAASDEGRSESVLSLLWAAFSRLSEHFQAERDAEGMTSNQGRVLSCLERFPGASVEFLGRHAFIGRAAAEDAVNSLMQAGLLTPLPNETFSLTQEGAARLEALRRRAAALEARLLNSVTPEALQEFRSVLQILGKHP